MTHQRSLEVTNGPSKFDLMVAQFDGKVVDFTIKGINFTEKFPCNIQGVSCEDQSREGWIVSGYFMNASDVFWKTRMEIGRKFFVLFYETKKRHGRFMQADQTVGLHL